MTARAARRFTLHGRNPRKSLMRTLWENEHVRLELDELQGVLVFTRSAEPFATIDAARDAFDAMVDAAMAVDSTRYGLLVDMRAPVGRSDPEFERATSKARARLIGRFPRWAILVRTAAGRLQMQRIARENGDPLQVFDDPVAALEYLSKASTASGATSGGEQRGAGRRTR